MTLSAEPAPRPTRARILLVEDDSALRELIATTLAQAGFEVIEASDGDAFIERLSEALAADETGQGFDVILSDIQMPTFNALDVLVGAHRLIGQTPVILITAFGDRPTHEQALRRGATVVLDKPVRMAVLRETVLQLLTQTQAQAQAGPPSAGL
jgi:CheY-like chemotaxis protein